MDKITSTSQLDNIYGKPAGPSIWKEIDHINDHYQQFIEASPFLILATYGDKGLDCSPRGDPAGFVRVVDSKTILIPDRRGNNRLDSLRNILQDPTVGLIFLIPGTGETIRVSGKAEILIDETLCASFAVNDKPASSVLKITVEKAYFQCQKALVRSKLWDASSYIDRSKLPTADKWHKIFPNRRVSSLTAKPTIRNIRNGCVRLFTDTDKGF